MGSVNSNFYSYHLTCIFTTHFTMNQLNLRVIVNVTLVTFVIQKENVVKLSLAQTIYVPQSTLFNYTLFPEINVKFSRYCKIITFSSFIQLISSSPSLSFSFIFFQSPLNSRWGLLSLFTVHKGSFIAKERGL